MYCYSRHFDVLRWGRYVASIEEDQIAHRSNVTCLKKGILSRTAAKTSELKATYFCTYLLTPCGRVLLEKLTGFAANQEIPRILWNPKVHYRTHKRPPPVPVLSHLHPVPTTPSHFLKIHLNIVSIYVLVSPVVSFPQISPPKPCAHLSLPPYVPHAPPISFFSILSPAQYWMRSTEN